MDLWWAYLLLGLAAGISGAALGIGGGVVMVPALVALFSYDQKVAQGTSMGAIIAISIVGFYRYWAEPDIKIDLVPVAFMFVAAAVGAYLGVKIAAALPKQTLQKIFAIVLVVAAVRLFLKSMGGKKDTPSPAVATAPAGTETGPPQTSGEEKPE